MPSCVNSCVIPTFFPMSPVTMSEAPRGLKPPLYACVARSLQAARPLLPVLFPECLDLDVDTGRQIELHQRVHRLRRRLEDVDQPLVRADLELLARLLVDMRRPQDRPLVLRGRQRDRAREPRPGPLGRLD